MANYAASSSLAGTPQAITTSYKTIVALTASSGTEARRFKVYDVIVGTLGTPADLSYEFDISRQTAAGTSTSITPNPLDPADAAALTVGTANFTGEGTITSASAVWHIAMNQRASFRWVASPGSELVAPATNLAGFALRCQSASGGTATASAEMFFQEQ